MGKQKPRVRLTVTECYSLTCAVGQTLRQSDWAPHKLAEQGLWFQLLAVRAVIRLFGGMTLKMIRVQDDGRDCVTTKLDPDSGVALVALQAAGFDQAVIACDPGTRCLWDKLVAAAHQEVHQ